MCSKIHRNWNSKTQNHFGIQIYERNWRLKPQCSFHRQRLLCVRFLRSVPSLHHVVSSCSLFVKHLPTFAKCCMNQCQKKAAEFQGWGTVFCKKPEVSFATHQHLFCRGFKTKPQKLRNGAGDCCRQGGSLSPLPSSHSLHQLWALLQNDLQKNPSTARLGFCLHKIKHERNGKLTPLSTSYSFHKTRGPRTQSLVTGWRVLILEIYYYLHDIFVGLGDATTIFIWRPKSACPYQTVSW